MCTWIWFASSISELSSESCLVSHLQSPLLFLFLAFSRSWMNKDQGCQELTESNVPHVAPILCTAAEIPKVNQKHMNFIQQLLLSLDRGELTTKIQNLHSQLQDQPPLALSIKVSF